MYDPVAALQRLTTAKGVAVFGASESPGKMGNTLFTALRDSPFRGGLAPVHPTSGQILGVPAYRSLLDVPFEIDYALVVLPPTLVPTAIDECALRHVGVVQVLSSGFADNDVPIEATVREAVSAGLRIIGPNCLGTYVPSAGISWTRRATYVPGSIGIVSQSGGLSTDLLLSGEEEGLRFSKIFSVGDCLDLDVHDYIRYLRLDPSTEAVGAYIESVGDGRRLFDELKRTAAVKPVFVIKGGRTRAGAKSVESHTGRMAGDADLWQAMLRQAGARQVRNVTGLLAAFKGLSLYGDGRPRLGQRGRDEGLLNATSRRVSLIGNGGGATVLACDRLEEADLRLAEFSRETRQRTAEISSATGERVEDNPIDLPFPRLFWESGRVLRRLIEAVARNGHDETVLVHVNLTQAASTPEPRPLVAAFVEELATLEPSLKVFFVFRGDGSELVEDLRRLSRGQIVRALGAPVFASIDEAIQAISVLDARLWAPHPLPTEQDTRIQPCPTS